MTTLAPPIPLTEQQHVVLPEVSWRFYQALLEEVGDRPIRITYYQGRIEIMSPLPEHEVWKKRIGRLIEMLVVELNIPMLPAGSTTFTREDLKAGLEPDECYYLEHAQAVRGKDRLDLTVDPPPDLAIEVDITSRSIPRQPIYAALGVPELWRFDGERLYVLHLTRSGQYKSQEASRAFPFLPMDEFRRYLLMFTDGDDTAVVRKFQAWARRLKRLGKAKS